jgi:hypothetical protein
VVHTIIATDIFYSDLAQRQMGCWKLAFESKDDAVKTLDNVSHKAAIVIEHLIQASDVGHTIQHLQVFSKWNEGLFQEIVWGLKDKYLNGKKIVEEMKEKFKENEGALPSSDV